jgi:hypothetical protein
VQSRWIIGDEMTEEKPDSTVDEVADALVNEEAAPAADAPISSSREEDVGAAEPDEVVLVLRRNGEFLEPPPEVLPVFKEWFWEMARICQQRERRAWQRN